jgi:protein-S-isoprenylcysteine O-methyltransferase Ste14
MVLQIDKNSSTSVQSIPEQLPKKKERKVGVVASFFLILGTFLVVYSIVGSMNVWAALGYFVFGFVAICIFLIIVAIKALIRRHSRSKQGK